MQKYFKKITKKYFNLFVNIGILIYSLFAFYISLKIASFLVPNNVLQYFVFEVILSIFVILEVIVSIHFSWKRNRSLLQKADMTFVLLVAFCVAVCIIKENPCSYLEILISFVSLLIGLPTIINYISRNSIDGMVEVYSPHMEWKAETFPTVNINKDKIITTTFSNLSSNDISIAFVGVFTRNQLESLRKEQKNWMKFFCFEKLDNIKALELNLKNNLFDYSMISSYGKSKPIKIDISKFVDQLGEKSSICLVYIDVFYKLHYMKLEVIGNKVDSSKENILNRNGENKLNKNDKINIPELSN